MDNEAFRYFCARERGMRFSDGERQKYKESFNRAQAEIKRMINYIAGLPSHNVSETVTLNEAREIVVRLSRPLASIANSIRENLALIEDRKERIENIDRTSKQYESELRIPRVRLRSLNMLFNDIV